MKSVVRALVVGAAVAAFYSAPAEAMELAGQGPKVGVGWSKLKNDDESHTVTGVTAGWALTFDVNDWFAFQPEILYSSKGGEGTVYDYFDWEADLSYIECQLLAKFDLSAADIKPVAFVGLSLGFNISDDVEISDNLVLQSEIDELGAKAFDLGYVLGLGAEFPAGDGIISVDVRYTSSLTYATEEVSMFYGFLPVFSKQKNQTFSVTLGYRF